MAARWDRAQYESGLDAMQEARAIQEWHYNFSNGGFDLTLGYGHTLTFTKAETKGIIRGFRLGYRAGKAEQLRKQSSLR